MSEIAIKVEDLGKQYQIGGEKVSYRTLRESLVEGIKAPFQRAAGLLRGESYSAAGLDQTIWALKDINLEIKKGEVVGVIGPNGAGKSTLLKILSRITEPTEGRALIRGRVGSLLEVGTGFHPELTGRENIYLNGSILGMHREEIEDKFDEIVEFSGVDKFIDTPLKHYSSGMQVRLAFSVASHLDPEILLIDEVLSVGDASFQKKSLGKMESVAGEGRTVLFVSHQLGMVNALCDQAIYLQEGHLIVQGSTHEVIDQYVNNFEERSKKLAHQHYSIETEKLAQILDLKITDRNSKEKTKFDVFEPVCFQAHFVINEPIQGLSFNLIVKRNGSVLFRTYDTDAHPKRLQTRKSGIYEANVELPSPLKAGHYSITPIIGIINVGGIDKKENAIYFSIEENSFDTSSRSYSSNRSGLMAAHLEWKEKKVSGKDYHEKP